jgi:flagellar hook protein FlgE
MSIFQSLIMGTTGIAAQSSVIGTASQNISNLSTVGYKRVSGNFQTLITESSPTNGAYSPGGARSVERSHSDRQGELLPTQLITDLGISGHGFFAVSRTSQPTGQVYYTRAGGFAPNAVGDFVNGAGFFLQGWRLDENGDLPAGLDTPTVTAGQAIAGLSTVNVAVLSETARATTDVTFRANLNASFPDYAGAPPYDATDPLANMASGVIAPHFSWPVTLIDPQGNVHTATAGFLKTGTNSWAVEFFASPASDLADPTNPQLAAGSVTFNGDASLATVSASLTGPIAVNWDNGTANAVTIDWGTIATTGGLSQFDSDFTASAGQNGIEPGMLTGIEISEEGTLWGLYNNGMRLRFYRIPLATFTDPNRLESLSGTIFAPTTDTSEALFNQPGLAKAGLIRSGYLESSTAELSEELTSIIIAQRAYQSNTRTISTTDKMLERLTEMVG